jgi:HSP20 family molecular chaperone IbpA
VRFFTPKKKYRFVDMSTLPHTMHVPVENHFDTIRVYQKSAGVLPVDIIRDGNDYKLVMTQGKITLVIEFR